MSWSEVRGWLAARAGPPAIYGTVVGGAVLASEEHEPVPNVVVAVVVTLVIYWAAERWSQVLGSQVAGEPLTGRRVRRVFGEGWPMVQASYLPVVVMVVASICGASADLSVNLGLLSIVVLLVTIGALAAHRAGLSRWSLIGSASFTGAFGLVLIGLKSFLH